MTKVDVEKPCKFSFTPMSSFQGHRLSISQKFIFPHREKKELKRTEVLPNINDSTSGHRSHELPLVEMSAHVLQDLEWGLIWNKLLPFSSVYRALELSEILKLKTTTMPSRSTNPKLRPRLLCPKRSTHLVEIR